MKIKGKHLFMTGMILLVTPIIGLMLAITWKYPVIVLIAMWLATSLMLIDAGVKRIVENGER